MILDADTVPIVQDCSTIRGSVFVHPLLTTAQLELPNLRCIVGNLTVGHAGNLGSLFGLRSLANVTGTLEIFANVTRLGERRAHCACLRLLNRSFACSSLVCCRAEKSRASRRSEHSRACFLALSPAALLCALLRSPLLALRAICCVVRSGRINLPAHCRLFLRVRTEHCDAPLHTAAAVSHRFAQHLGKRDRTSARARAVLDIRSQFGC
jgi:hypothetical protein